MTNTCSFCDPKTIIKQEIAVIGSVRVLYPRKPIIPESVLIMPVRCVEHIHELSDEETKAIFLVVNKLQLAFKELYNSTGYNFFANDGRVAGQHVPHVHFHFYGRSENETVNPFDILGDKEKYQNRPQMPDDEYNKNIDQIKNSLLS